MAKNNNGTLAGKNIYRDKKNRIIYYDFISKKSYYIFNEDENKIFFYKNRFTILLFAAILGVATILTKIQAGIILLSLLIIIEIYYRLFVFKKLKIVKDKDIEKKEHISPIQAILETKPRSKIITLIVLYTIFSILIVVNAILENYSLAMNVLSGLLAVFGLYFAIIHLIALTKSK